MKGELAIDCFQNRYRDQYPWMTTGRLNMRISSSIATARTVRFPLDKVQAPAFGSRYPGQPLEFPEHNGPDPLGILRLSQILDNQHALQAEELAIKLLEASYGDIESEILLRNAWAASLVKQKRYQEALKQYEKTLTLSQKHFGPKHLETATFHQRIGQVYLKLAEDAGYQYRNKRQATRYFKKGKKHLNTALKLLIACLPANAAQIGLAVADHVAMYEIGYSLHDQKTRRFCKQLVETPWESHPQLKADIRYWKERFKHSSDQ